MTKNNSALSLLRKEFSELGKWLKPLCRFDKIEDFVLSDYKEKTLRLKIFTKDHSYSIVAKLPEVENDGTPLEKGQERKVVRHGYLSCIAQTRKPRAGEDWNRGNDLADGSYSRETFEKIAHNIIAYELVKIVKPVKAIEDRIVKSLPAVVGGKEKKIKE